MFYASRFRHRRCPRAAERQVQLHRGEQVYQEGMGNFFTASRRAVYLLTFDGPQTPRSDLPKMVMLYLETERHLTSLRENPDHAAATPTLWCSRAGGLTV